MMAADQGAERELGGDINIDSDGVRLQGPMGVVTNLVRPLGGVVKTTVAMFGGWE